MTTNLSEHFSYHEGTYSKKAVELGVDNSPSTVQLENMKVAAQGMEKVRALLNKPISVQSWLRLPKVNVAVGGSEKSAHMDGFAIDFRCDGFGSPYEICKAITESGIKYDQLIHEYSMTPDKGWVHISFDPALKRQNLTVMRPANPHKMYVPGIVTPAEYAAWKP
jgi:putative chitinase